MGPGQIAEAQEAVPNVGPWQLGKPSKLKTGKTWEKFPTGGGSKKIHKVPKFHLGNFSE